MDGTTEDTNRDRGRVQTTETSIAIIEAIYQLNGATLTELASRLDLADSTVHNHLSTLNQNGLLVKEGTEYYLSLKFLEFGRHAIERKSEYNIAEKKVAELIDQTDAVADFSVEEHGQIISLYNELYYENESPFFDGRRRFYMHCSAAGKAILSEYSDDQVRKIVDRHGLPQSTDQTITSEEELFMELDKVRKRGYATNDEEQFVGLFSIGAAVTYPNGDIVGAFSIDLPTYRAERENIDALVNELHTTIEEMETEIESQYLELVS